MARKEAGPFSAERLGRLLAGRDPKTVLKWSGLIGVLKKALAERILNAEMDVHLDADPRPSFPIIETGRARRRS